MQSAKEEDVLCMYLVNTAARSKKIVSLPSTALLGSAKEQNTSDGALLLLLGIRDSSRALGKQHTLNHSGPDTHVLEACQRRERRMIKRCERVLRWEALAAPDPDSHASV